MSTADCSGRRRIFPEKMWNGGREGGTGSDRVRFSKTNRVRNTCTREKSQKKSKTHALSMCQGEHIVI